MDISGPAVAALRAHGGRATRGSITALPFPDRHFQLICALDIVEHYKIGQALPGGMERARTLARHPSYVFVEVYFRQVRAVSADGTVTTLDL